MKKKLKDYLNLYVGAMCHVDAGEFPEQTLPILGVMDNKALLGLRSIQIVEIKDCKPLLRPLLSITNEEKVIMHDTLWPSEFHYSLSHKCTYWFLKCDNGKYDSETFHYLITILNVDLFGLIEAGLAIDKTKINQNENK